MIDEKVIEVQGLPVRYLEGGTENGRALLLLHGGIGDAWANWHEVLPALANEFHVFAPDLPGFGGSAALPQMSMDHLVEWMRGLLDALEQTDVVIVGNFIGALVARLFASAAPSYVPAIILVNGGTIPHIPAFIPRLVRLPLVGELILDIFGRITCSHKMIAHMVYVQSVLTDGLLESWHQSAPGF